MPSVWEEKINRLRELIMKPMLYNDLYITLIDALPALHSRDWVVGEHRHPWFEFNYVSDGALFTMLEGREFLASAGSYYLIPPGAFHSHRHCENQGDDGFCLRWQLEVVPFPREYANIPSVAKSIIEALMIPSPAAVSRNMGLILDETGENPGIAALQAVFLKWLLELCRNREEKETGKFHSESRENAMIRQALLYLNEYYAQPLKVQDLANSLNVSYRHLARLFKQVTGVTIIGKLNDIRVNQAKNLLKDTDVTIRDIALRVGFENEFYFTNIFSHYTYTTPSAFRKKFR